MENNLSRPAELLRELIQCRSITPQEGGALSCLEGHFQRLGFETHRVIFSDEDTPDVDNLYARLGTSAPHICFAGHTDVVPVGIEADWSSGPFEGVVEDGMMIGRGTVDMKGGIACFLASVEAYLNENETPTGSISFLITGDEEGPSINGTDKLLKWAKERGEVFDACIVGEPSNPAVIGDAIKIGRRGSMSGRITVKGVQGHSAYPHLADNPVRGMMDMLDSLLAEPFDEGTDDFQPTNLEVTSVDVGNTATNVIPGNATAAFNVRFNDTWSGESLREEIIRRLEEGTSKGRIRRGKNTPAKFEMEWLGRISPVFLTSDETLVKTLSDAIEAETGSRPELSTGGGTSDARFVKDYCPVVEFGLVGKTMHQVNECVALDDLDKLTAIYGRFLNSYFE
ncbi:MAG: succinyl-diaminopimelate desuccinylase [Hyphomicrobiales bacterium]|nr:MAG: succinyl-diaminopimelate desuccinylase [Hyphomicrobiales bacterium]